MIPRCCQSLRAGEQQLRHHGPSITTQRCTIARFGWKAQNKSLVLFSGEAYNVEWHLNEIFGQDGPSGEDSWAADSLKLLEP